MQGDGESFDQFVTELMLLVKDCSYDKSDEMVRDRIVFATNSARVREKLLCHGPDLTLEKAIDIARSHELSQQQLKRMDSATTVHAVSRRPFRPTKPRYGRRNVNKTDVMTEECGACGREHSRAEECPAKGRQCNNCNKFNHLC